jgi:hypothetical protein
VHASERARPTISAPIAAPSMLPSPPMMTTANETMMTPTETPRLHRDHRRVNAPPIAARKMPIENASM